VVVGFVADHGMSDMAIADGAPHVVYLGDVLDAAYDPDAVRVICPITDPFVRHHGALGGFVRVHLRRAGLSAEEVAASRRRLPEVELALTRDEACVRFELPPDREGDVEVIARKGIALGARRADHDLSQLAGARLRSHGGLAEQPVPFYLSRSLSAAQAAMTPSVVRNYDIFDFALNRIET
jgi:phosphonoacetate hydrolase